MPFYERCRERPHFGDRSKLFPGEAIPTHCCPSLCVVWFAYTHTRYFFFCLSILPPSFCTIPILSPFFRLYLSVLFFLTFSALWSVTLLCPFLLCYSFFAPSAYLAMLIYYFFFTDLAIAVLFCLGVAC
jgi:hypothetical protein